MSLQDIADETKINIGLLVDLERGNLSQWPPGLYGRAFIRSYAEAVGLEPREVLAEFLRLVPADEGVFRATPGPDEEPHLPGWTFKGSQTGRLSSDPDGVALRLTLAGPDGGGRLPVPRRWRRIAASAFDGALLLAGAAIGRSAMGPDGWLPGLAGAAVAMVALASAVLGTTPGRRLFTRSTDLRVTRRAGHQR